MSDAANTTPSTATQIPRLRVMVRGFPARTPRAVLKQYITEGGIDAKVMPTFLRRPGQYNIELRNHDDMEKLKELFNGKLSSVEADVSAAIGAEVPKRENRELKFDVLPPRPAKSPKASTEETKDTNASDKPAPANNRRAPARRANPRNNRKTKIVETPRPGAIYFNISQIVEEKDIRDLIPEYPNATVFISKHNGRRSGSQGFVLITVEESEKEKAIESLKGKEVAGKPINPSASVIRRREPVQEDEKKEETAAESK